MACYDTYRDQLASLYYGHALWVPDPSELYDRVRVGDVGYVKQGHFLRMFNALLPANDDAQEYGVPEGFVPLNMGPFKNIRKLNLFHGDYCSNTVTVDHVDRHQATGPNEDTSASFRCSRNNKGAFLSLPLNGVREDAIRTKAFETYIRKHCDSWLEFASVNEIDVRLEDIIFVTGCDLTSSWAMAAFVNSLDQEVSLNVRVSNVGSARFQWTPTSQPHHNEPNQNVAKSHCVFIRGFRAKRILPFFKTLRAAAEPRLDNPDNEPESSISIEILREPTVPDYRDPLIGILDYIAEQRPDQLAIAHEDNLKMVEGVDVLTADAVESFLRQNKIPVQCEEGVAFLADGEEGVAEEKMTFHARAGVDDEQLPLTIHPVLMKSLLEFDIASQSLDYDFGLPTEDLLSSAVHPPVNILVLENEQGLPQNIEVQASDKRSGIGVTVEDVLNTVGLHLQKSSSQREWPALNAKTEVKVEAAFEDQVRTEERTGDLWRIDYSHDSLRNRQQSFPKHPLPELEDDGIQSLPHNLMPNTPVSIRLPTFLSRIFSLQGDSVTSGSSRSSSSSSLYPVYGTAIVPSPLVLSLPRSKTPDSYSSTGQSNAHPWQAGVSTSASGSSTYDPEPSPTKSPARAPRVHIHPLLSYTLLRHAPISYDIAFTPSARTVVDRTIHAPVPAATLAQPATEPPIPASSRLVLRSPKLPWTVAVEPIGSLPSLFIDRQSKATTSAELTNLDVLNAVHTTLMTRVTPEEWAALGEGSRAQRRVAEAYKQRCTRMGGGWEGGIRRVDWLGSKTHLVGVEIDKSSEAGENVGRLVFGRD